MKQHFNIKALYFLHTKTINVLVVILSIIGIAISGFSVKNGIPRNLLPGEINSDSVASVKAFLDVYKVLMSPRCMNCHPAGDRPLQGDSGHIHTMNVQRGKDGKGLYALKCSNCHQPENAEANHAPPGNPKWQLPPANMKMVFQDKSAHDLALQIMDYSKNGHKNIQQLLEHARDTLVKAGWNMGKSHQPPPLSYQDFVAAWDTWINTGGYAPKQ
ncbi:MAG: hypothetical protein ABI416_10835 [Ginsengibacter sp.]